MALVQNDAYRYFKEEIEEVGNKKIRDLEEEIESIKAKSLLVIEEELNDTVTRAKLNELDEMNTEYHAQLNRIKLATHQEIIKKKRDLFESVLLEVKNKLQEFVKTDEYKNKMILLVKKINKEFCGKNVTFKVKQKDNVMKNIIKENYKHDCDVVEDELILLGGFIAICNDKGILTDQTIDSSLEEKKKWFYENSKLAIKK
ncbi:MAG: hypothetical protein PQJ44_05695 [Sphaerochaetaceae bacterium]|nr:hypothetical protein [Sphaerochaetaceae bacterium]